MDNIEDLYYVLYKHIIWVLCSVIISHFELLPSLVLLGKNVYMSINYIHQTTMNERIIIQMYLYLGRTNRWQYLLQTIFMVWTSSASWDTSTVWILKYFYWLLQGGTFLVDHLCYLCLVFVMLLRLFIAALWSPAGKGLTSCLWCLSVFLSLSHVVSWVRCGTWLYRFLIFATFLSLISISYSVVQSLLFQNCEDFFINTNTLIRLSINESSNLGLPCCIRADWSEPLLVALLSYWLNTIWSF